MSHLQLSQKIIDHFQIENHHQVARGGQKMVFKVQIDQKTYALKSVFWVDERMRREIDIIREFENHPGIPTFYEVKEIEGQTYILEEYIEGKDLHDKLDDFIGKEKEVCKLILEIAEILKPIWERRIVHRDLKPENIRLRPDDTPVVLDFGIARVLDDKSITRTGDQPRSPLYASPEQYAGRKDRISYRTDFFCLGIIAYRLYTGMMPFGDDPEEIQQSFEKKKSLYFDTGSKRISEFCKNVLALNLSERPRYIEQFKELLR